MIKIALVGCGRIAKRHATLLHNKEIEGASLIAVCDPSEERRQCFSKDYNVPGYSSISELMNSECPDLLAILTESGQHCAHVIEAASYDTHVLVEKPMALTLDDADKMIAAFDNSSKRLFVVKQNRFNKPVLKLREAIDSQRFGKLILGTVRVRWCRDQAYYDQDAWRGTWKDDGGVLTNQASHHIDLLQWILGDVDTVTAMSSNALAKIETEDTATVLLKFKNGALGVIEATTATRPKDLEGSISILGEKGCVEIAGFAVNQLKTWEFQDESPMDEEVKTHYSENPPNVYGFGHKAYYQDMIQSIQSNSAQLVDGNEGRKSIALLHAIYSAIETGETVRLSDNPVSKKLGK